MNSCKWNHAVMVLASLLLCFLISTTVDASDGHLLNEDNTSSGISNNINNKHQNTDLNEHVTGEFSLDRFEYAADLSDLHQQAVKFEANAWYGNNTDKVVFETEGEIVDTSITSSEHKLLWQRTFDNEINFLAGFHLIKEGDYQREAAIFLTTGELSPRLAYEVSASFSNKGPAIFNLELEDSWQWAESQSVITTVALSGHSKNDLENGIASGPSEFMIEMYNEYRISNAFATYIGLSYTKLLDNTAELARNENESTHLWEIFVGVNLAF